MYVKHSPVTTWIYVLTIFKDKIRKGKLSIICKSRPNRKETVTSDITGFNVSQIFPFGIDLNFVPSFELDGELSKKTEM